MIEVDKLKVLDGDPIVISDRITIYQPTLRQIREFGEQNYNSIIWNLCQQTYDVPSMLDDLGIDFMKFSDFEFFGLKMKMLENTDLQSVFGDLTFKGFEGPYIRNQNESDLVYYRKEDDFIIDVETYETMIGYLREIINFQHQGKKAANKYTAKILIDDDRKKRKENDGKPYESMFFDMIVSLVNTEEFKYDYKSVYDLTAYQLMKSFVQINGKKQALAMLQASMSGFVDMSGVPKEDFSWTYSDDKFKPKHRKLINDQTKK